MPSPGARHRRVRYAFLCDFDGTITPRDVGAEFLKAFALPGSEPERRALVAAWEEGRVGTRELAEAECRLASASLEQANAFVRRFELDRHFEPFAREAEARGDRVLVVSEGFEFYIEQLLARAGLLDLERIANRLEFEDGRLIPVFPNAGLGCGRCGNCKGAHADRARREGYRVVLVGDGLSDRCAAQAADHVFARGALAQWCAAEGIATCAFESFADVARLARDLPGRVPVPETFERGVS